MALSDPVPVDSPFPAKSTGVEVVALTGKTAIVTVGYVGIGLETLRGPASNVVSKQLLPKA